MTRHWERALRASTHATAAATLPVLRWLACVHLPTAPVVLLLRLLVLLGVLLVLLLLVPLPVLALPHVLLLRLLLLLLLVGVLLLGVAAATASRPARVGCERRGGHVWLRVVLPRRYHGGSSGSLHGSRIHHTPAVLLPIQVMGLRVCVHRGRVAAAIAGVRHRRWGRCEGRAARRVVVRSPGTEALLIRVLPRLLRLLWTSLRAKTAAAVCEVGVRDGIWPVLAAAVVLVADLTLAVPVSIIMPLVPSTVLTRA